MFQFFDDRRQISRFDAPEPLDPRVTLPALLSLIDRW